ncbi:MAG: metal-dependent phosphohydrolase [Candidatus Sericytochromatia bacterium]|nr:MAG: metal-dependent phosphohydrolase [Candidatus Sericytochromatia bacterium]
MLPKKELTISRFIPGNERRKFKDIIKFLAMVIDLAEGYKFQNNYRVALSGVQLASEISLSVDSIRNVFYGGLLHDVGEVGLLEENENKINQYIHDIKPNQHTIFGSRIVSLIPTLDGVTKIIRWHHECWDGSGFPDGLKGEQIPIEAAIVSLFDAFYVIKTITDKKDDLISYLEKMKGTRFNPEIIEKFLKLYKNEELWTPENFDEVKWTAIGMDAFEIAKLQDVKGDYVEIALNVIAQVIDAKHKYTHGHSRRVMALASLIADRMGLDKNYRTLIEQGALLHDSGKVGISRSILDKESSLNDEEYQIIKKHPVISCVLIENFTTLKEVAPLAKYHHERYDGKGYPNSLVKDDIPLGARIIAVADAYDAMTSDRAYRKALPDNYARHEIRRYTGKMFDPQVVDAFLDIPEHEIKLAFDIITNQPISSISSILSSLKKN